MCVNLKTFNESFRKWAEEQEEEEWLSEQSESSLPEQEVPTLFLADLDRKKLIAVQTSYVSQY